MGVSPDGIGARSPISQAPTATIERRPERVAERLASIRMADDERRSISRRSTSSRLRRLAVVVLLLAAGAAAAFNVYGFPRFGAPVIPAVRIAEDEQAGLVLTLSGVIVPSTSVNVTSVVPGKIVELPLEEGVRVKKGDLLARIEGTGFRADHAEAVAALALAESHLLELRNGARPEEIAQMRAKRDEAQVQYVLAAKEVVRAESLREKNALSDSGYDQLIATKSQSQSILEQLTQQLALIEKGTRDEVVAGAEAEVERAKARCAKTKCYVEQTDIIAPIDGTVLEKKATLGEVTRSDYLPTTLCLLGDLSRMQAEVDIQERELQKIHIGQHCRISPDALAGQSDAASVARFQPLVNRQRGVFKVTVMLDRPDDKLLSEMNCRVEFRDDVTVNGPGPLRVPKAAVFQEGVTSAVWVLENEAVAQRVVQIGEANAAGMAEIKSGLAVGDVVLVPGDQKLKAGQRAVPRFE